MFINFYNDSDQLTKIVTSQQTVYVQPKQLASIEYNKESSFAFSLECDSSSRVSRGKYILSIKSNYVCEPHAQDISFRLVQEKVRVNFSVCYYERLLVVNSDFECRLVSCEVLGKAEVIRRYKRKRMIRFFFIEPLECFTGLVVLMVILGGGLLYFFGWEVATIGFLVCYLLILMLIWATSKVSDWLLKKTLRQDDEKTKFYHLLESEYITKFFLETNRDSGM